MYKNTHDHEQRRTTTRAPSPVRELVSKYVNCNLTETQIKNLLVVDCPSTSIPRNQLSNLINYTRRKNNPDIFSVYDFNQWCINHSYDENSLHSTFIPYYYINDINDIFVLFATKQLLKDAQSSTLLQVDATYKLTWNELPLLVFGSSDVDRHFRPFGVALISSDETSTCYIDLFKQLKLISTQENQREYVVNYVMADGAPGITSAQKEVFPQARRLMCWAHVARKCREHRKLVPTEKWKQIDIDIHNLQLCFSDNIFSHGTNLLMKKWSTDPLIQQFQSYFFNQWIETLPLWYEGAAINMPLTSNGCESLNSIIKKKYTMRNKLHLSSFLPKIEQMLNDWSTASSSNVFVSKPSISSDLELCAFKWSNNIDKLAVLHWFDSWYIVPSSNSLITPAVWLQMYQLQRWSSFDGLVIWLKSCRLVSPLFSCTCPTGLKYYVCKHSVGLAMMLNQYEVNDKTRLQLLGKRRGKGRSKKVQSALLL
ncbi:unnamed protein product [Rotaria sp. Silwood2]|nr:unnamed protein product [Rotaria sp. Silwood2]